MPCLYCNASFSLIRWKKKCDFCSCLFCTSCIVQKRCLACAHVLNCQWKYDSLMNVKIKDLKLYLSVRGEPVHLLKEKNELVRMVIVRNQNKVRGAASASAMPHARNLSTETRRSNNQSPQTSTSPENINVTGARITVQGGGSEARTTAHTSNIARGPVPSERNNTSSTAPSTGSNTYSSPLSAGVSVQNQASSPNQQGSTTDLASGDVEKVDSPQKGRPIPSGLGNKIVIGDLTSVEQVELLSPREMKQILQDNFIDYKGCLEKSELQSRVRSLYQEKACDRDVQNDASADDSNICKICWDQTIDCVFLECGHMVTCTSCGKRLSECPICRQYIVKCVHVFRS